MSVEQQDQIIRELEAAYPLADSECIVEMYKAIVGPSKEVSEHEIDEIPW